MLYRSVDAVSVTHLMSLVAQEVYLYVSVKGKCVQSSAQTERAAQMQGWMNIQWRRPEEDLQGDVSRKVPLHTTPPLPMKLRTRAFHHTFCTQRYNGFRKWGCFLRTVQMLLFPICWVDAKSWTHSLRRGTKLSSAHSWNTVALRSTFPSLMGGLIHEWSLSLWLRLKERYEVNSEW